MPAAFLGPPGIFELLILFMMCGLPVIVVLIVLLVLKPWKRKGEFWPCPDCGHPVPVVSKTCPQCGKQLQE
jgi:hypothetical protein